MRDTHGKNISRDYRGKCSLLFMYAHSHDAIVKYVIRAAHNYHSKVTNGHKKTQIAHFWGIFPSRQWWEIFTSFSTCWKFILWIYVWMFIFILHHTTDEKAIFTTWKLFFICANWQSYELHSVQFFLCKKPTRKLFSRLSLNSTA
jgi:hypothetical protein